jgi:hypothetical protein
VKRSEVKKDRRVNMNCIVAFLTQSALSVLGGNSDGKYSTNLVDMVTLSSESRGMTGSK